MPKGHISLSVIKTHTHTQTNVSSIAGTSPACSHMVFPCSSLPHTPMRQEQISQLHAFAWGGTSTDIPLPFNACHNPWLLLMSLTPGNTFSQKKAPLYARTFCWHFLLSALSLLPPILRDLCIYLSFTLPCPVSDLRGTPASPASPVPATQEPSRNGLR